MNKTKRICAMLLCILMLCSTVLLCACQSEPKETESSDAAYKVTVVDGLGNPYTEKIIVKFMQNGTQAAMAVVNAEGAVEKILPKGDYTVEVMSTSSGVECYYDASAAILSADKTELEIVMAYKAGKEYQTIYDPTRLEENEDGVEINPSVDAPVLNTGSTYVGLENGIRNYFLFAPTEAGTYEFSVSDDAAAVGYYGSPYFIQTTNISEVNDNKFTVSVSSSMIGTGNTGTVVLVIGLDAVDGNTPGCILNVARIGDPERTIEDEPWIIYQTTVALAPYTLGDNKLKEFDLTAATETYNLVLNGEDGFYHLNSADGPLVLVRLGEPSKYLESFKKILESSGVNRYFYDEEENFVKKESYSECLNEYIEYMDPEKGVYPLTEDLKYIIQQRGEYTGWWDASGGLYLFRDENGVNIPGINHEIAWLFMCCYVAN